MNYLVGTDLEAVLADVSYLMAMEKSKTVAFKAAKKLPLPDPRFEIVRSIMFKYLKKRQELTFEIIFDQTLGYLLFKQYCDSLPDGGSLHFKFYEAVTKFEHIETDEERIIEAKEIYDNFIMRELLTHSHNYSQNAVDIVQETLTSATKSGILAPDIFKPYINELRIILKEEYFERFIMSEYFTRFCQWKNLEFNIYDTGSDISFCELFI
ncbi:unnamed protein product [Protopolystoma xenopodis]|uniref:RGS domain-containing protein n=1 Tax=Protopolystoma xenopodis TaxID=117903 RepID=A0A448XQL8_9PLAT|nr:unnamed protein product [Protopolystoma xenopodis]